ncbi:hypothetical protein L1049_013549 [Liquidambar formosana]|uniref:DUF4283 domain-containing protein n=1 Tax=Liquidambar formosana TaxID=63359 RepID=A0AAP0WWY4_LIQFO
MVTVKITESAYRSKLADSKTNVLGRILLPKGAKPLTVLDLKAKLVPIWNMIGEWRLVSLEKVYFDIHFYRLEDMRKVWAGGNWNLNPGLFRISRWIADFNPHNQVQRHSQVWIRIFGLPQEYWHHQNPLEIARGAGLPLQIDRATLNQIYGLYARILVEIDMSQPLPESIRSKKVLVFFVDVYYENLPSFCSQYQSIGHKVAHCKLVKDSGIKSSPSLPNNAKAKYAMSYRPKKQMEVQDNYQSMQPVNVEASVATSQLTPTHVSNTQEVIYNAVDKFFDDVAKGVLRSDQDKGADCVNCVNANSAVVPRADGQNGETREGASA